MYRQGDGNEYDHDVSTVRAPKKRKLNIHSTGVLILSAGRRRPRVLHFRWKKFRLTLCLGGTAIAAWPGADEDDMRALVQTKMIDGHYDKLSHDQRKIRSMALRLRAALVKAEEGPRRKSATRQRKRLDYFLRLGIYKPVVQAPVKATWKCTCNSGYGYTYALSVESCQWCHKKAPRQRRLRLPDNSR
jgi:hypothetical protein